MKITSAQKNFQILKDNANSKYLDVGLNGKIIVRTSWLGKKWKELRNRSHGVDTNVLRKSEETFRVIDEQVNKSFKNIPENYSSFKKPILEKLREKIHIPKPQDQSSETSSQSDLINKVTGIGSQVKQTKFENQPLIKEENSSEEIESKELEEIEAETKKLQETQAKAKELEKIEAETKKLQETQAKAKELEKIEAETKKLQDTQAKVKELERIKDEAKKLKDAQAHEKEIEKIREEGRKKQEDRKTEIEKLKNETAAIKEESKGIREETKLKEIELEKRKAENKKTLEEIKKSGIGDKEAIRSKFKDYDENLKKEQIKLAESEKNTIANLEALSQTRPLTEVEQRILDQLKNRNA